MRRVWYPVLVGLVALGVATPAGADPAPSALPIPVPTTTTPPSSVCTISTDAKGAVDISGMAATSSGYVVIDGKNTDWGLHIVTLNDKCVRTSIMSYPGGGATDPEDIQVDSKGVMWIADTGDDPVQPSRTTVSLWKVATSGKMTRYDFSYPDGPHNVEALLLNGSGAPIFITKAISGPASIYTFAGTLSTASTMALTKAGTFQPEQTGTPNKLGNRGQAQNEITGAANSPDGSHVALRTLSDAYEFDVTGGDVIAALTKGKPRITPLPNEDQGYSIAYTTDGKSLLTVSDSSDSVEILKYTPTPAAGVGGKGSKAAKLPGPPSAFKKWFDSLTLSDFMWILGGIAAFGLLLVGLGIYGIRRSRRLHAARAAASGGRKSTGTARPMGTASPPGSGPASSGGGGPGGSGPGGGSGRAASPVPVGGGSPGVYGAPRSVAQEPYNSYGSGVGYPPPVDPYAQPPAGGRTYGGGQGGGVYGGGGGQGGGVYGGGQQGSAHQGGVGYGAGGHYGTPADPYQGGQSHGDPGYPDDGYRGGYR